MNDFNIIEMKSLSSASAALEDFNESVTENDEDLTLDVGTIENAVTDNEIDNEVEFEYDIYGSKEDDVAAANDIM